MSENVFWIDDGAEDGVPYLRVEVTADIVYIQAKYPRIGLSWGTVQALAAWLREREAEL